VTNRRTIMPEPIDEKVKAAVKAFEDADDLFQYEPGWIFGTESERKAALYAALTKKWKVWERSGPCMYRGCPNTSITRSHSIHRAGPMEQIAEQQHVLTPGFGQNGITVNRIGVREASTFPGFCETHEHLFSSFETTGQIADGHQTMLQAFRTLCREIARKRHDVEHLRSLLGTYRATRFNYFKTSILAAAPGVDIQDVSEKGNKKEEFAASSVAEGESDLQELEELYDEMFQYVDSGFPEPCVQALNISPDIHLEIPVTLSGLGVLRYQDAARKKHRALCLLGILPQGKTTLTFIAAARRHGDAIAFCMNKMLSGFGALHAMESWMVYGSDHWFIRPSAWEAIPEARRSLILKAIENVDYNIGDAPPFSILDEARRRLISYLRDHIDETDDKRAALRQLAIEEAKLQS
jgi:hypothetical protein